MSETVSNFFNAVRPNGNNNRLAVPSPMKMKQQASASSQIFLPSTSLLGEWCVLYYYFPVTKRTTVQVK